MPTRRIRCLPQTLQEVEMIVKLARVVATTPLALRPPQLAD
jgi:hypothetical protein